MASGSTACCNDVSLHCLYMKFYLRPDLVRRKFSKSEGRTELMEMAGGAQVLGEIIKSTVLKVVPRVGLGKWATV